MREHLRATFKILAFSLTVILYSLTAIICYPLVLLDAFKGRRVLSYIIAFYSRLSLLFMGVRVIERFPLDKMKNSMIVSNHLGYLDVLIIASRIPCSFVTSLEIKKTPFLGQLCELGGCLYVNRKSRENLSQEVSMLSSGLENGLNICVFPEGTSTNGEAVLKFKRPLFKAAVDADSPVVSLCLNYKTINQRPITPLNRDFIFWYGDMSFLPHLWNFFKQQSTVVEMNCVGINYEMADYTYLSEQTHSYISSKFIAIH